MPQRIKVNKMYAAMFWKSHDILENKDAVCPVFFLKPQSVLGT